MKKIILVGILLLLGWLGWYLLSPLFIDRVVNEALPIADSASSTYRVVATGSFTGFDSFHKGSGTAQLIEVNGTHVLRFEEDFSVTNGPDLHVGFGNNGSYVEGSEIAALKGNIGSQNYELLESFDPLLYNEIWIWCKQFSVPFAKARISPIQ